MQLCAVILLLLFILLVVALRQEILLLASRWAGAGRCRAHGNVVCYGRPAGVLRPRGRVPCAATVRGTWRHGIRRPRDYLPDTCVRRRRGEEGQARRNGARAEVTPLRRDVEIGLIAESADVLLKRLADPKPVRS